MQVNIDIAALTAAASAGLTFVAVRHKTILRLGSRLFGTNGSTTLTKDAHEQLCLPRLSAITSSIEAIRAHEEAASVLVESMDKKMDLLLANAMKGGR